jgi:hypothetical protein
MPRFFKGKEYEDRDPVRPSKPFIPEYPMEAAHKGCTAASQALRFFVDAGGFVRSSG